MQLRLHSQIDLDQAANALTLGVPQFFFTNIKTNVVLLRAIHPFC